MTRSTIDKDLRRFLGRGYEVKSDADYGTSPHETIDLQRAQDMIALARRFVAWNEKAILGNLPE